MPAPSAQAVASATDLVEAIQEVLRASSEPLTPAKVRAALPGRLRALPVRKIAEVLQRQAAAQVLVLYPKYRSQHDRYWDRPMRDHVEDLLRRHLAVGPLPRADLRRRLPAYARILADVVLSDMLRQGRMHAHPGQGRAGLRYGLTAADPGPFVRVELEALFARLERLGFARPAVRAAALGALQQEEFCEEPSVGPPYRADRLTMAESV